MVKRLRLHVLSVAWHSPAWTVHAVGHLIVHAAISRCHRFRPVCKPRRNDCPGSQRHVWGIAPENVARHHCAAWWAGVPSFSPLCYGGGSLAHPVVRARWRSGQPVDEGEPSCRQAVQVVNTDPQLPASA